jgi:competence protein ComEC
MTGIGLTFLAAGISLGAAARAQAVRAAPAFGLPGEKIIALRGILLDDPRTLKGGRGMGTLALEEAAGKDGIRASSRGQIPVFFPEEAIPRLKTFGRGSRVYIDGALIDSSGAEGPLFRARSAHVMESAGAPDRLRTIIRLNLLERLSGRPWGGLTLALLLGIRDNLDHELAAAYRNAGCSHVLALSGMHLGILSLVIAFLLKKPLGLKPAALLGALLILLYVYLAGVQPSLERAAIMFLLGTLLVLANLSRNPLSLLGLTFLVQIVLRPVSGDSISFLLSYLALGGILLVGEAIHRLLRGFIPEVLSGPLSASLGAFIATAGISAAFFGVLRPIGIPAGIAIVPLTTVFMVVSMVWLVLSGIFPLVASPLGFILSFLYDTLSRLVGAAGRAWGMEVSAPFWIFCVSIAAAGALIWVSARRIKMRNRLAPFA